MRSRMRRCISITSRRSSRPRERLRRRTSTSISPIESCRTQEELVVGGLGERAVEGEVDLDARLQVVDSFSHLPHGLVDARRCRRRWPARPRCPAAATSSTRRTSSTLRVVEHAAVDEVAHRLAHGLCVDGHDAHAAAASDLEQALGVQGADRLADDGARDAELLAQLPLRRERVARFEPVRERSSPGSPRSPCPTAGPRDRPPRTRVVTRCDQVGRCDQTYHERSRGQRLRLDSPAWTRSRPRQRCAGRGCAAASRAGSGALSVATATQAELGGPGGESNPEELFSAALANCFTSTLTGMARARGDRAGRDRDDGVGAARLGRRHGPPSLRSHLPRGVASPAPEADVRGLVADAEAHCPVCQAIAGRWRPRRVTGRSVVPPG